jgi:hypothetical protein
MDRPARAEKREDPAGLCGSCTHAKMSCTVLPAKMGIAGLRFFCAKGHYDIRPVKKEDLYKGARTTCPDFELHERQEKAEARN